MSILALKRELPLPSRALSLQPKVLLLDEVMAGLSQNEMQQALHLILKLRKDAGVSILWVEHVMKAILKAADRVAVLHQGKILCVGLPHEVMQNQDVIDAYLGKALHVET